MSLIERLTHFIAIGLVPAAVWSLVIYVFYRIKIKKGLQTESKAGIAFLSAWGISTILGFILGSDAVDYIQNIGGIVAIIAGFVWMLSKPIAER